MLKSFRGLRMDNICVEGDILVDAKNHEIGIG